MELKEWFKRGCVQKSLTLYLETFGVTLSVMQDKDALFRVAKEEVLDLARENVVYAEIRFAPELHTKKGMNLEDVVTAVLKGLEAGRKETGMEFGLILCAMRNEDPALSLEVAELAVAFSDRGVVGFDLAGDECGHPPKKHIEAFNYIRSKNFNITIHAGEADGPESVKIALDYGTKRIGHGVKSTEDTSLMQRLSDEGITLEFCPTSNLNTAIFPSISQFPYRLFLDKNVKFTINSDNMAVSATNVIREFQLLNDTFHLTYSEVKQLLMNSIDASFASESLKKELRANVNKAFLQNSNTLAKQKLD